MIINGLYFGIGLLALYLGAEWLIRGAAQLARRLGVTPLVVGLTVVAFGSSAPELLVGVVASAQDQGDVVVGNVLGSNVINIALILGAAAVVRPMRVGMRLLSREIPLMVAASVAVALMMLDGALGRVDAGLLLVGFCGFLAFVLLSAKSEPEAIAREFGQPDAVEGAAPADGSILRDAIQVVVGLGGLVIGAQLLVMSAVFLARTMGVSEVVIGLTVVALGTSLPELATCVVAAFRDESDIALGNAVGSNLFNLLSILGVSAMIRPLRVERELFELEIPAMIGFAVLLVPLAWRGRTLSRPSGAILLLAYAAFTAILLVRTAA